MAARHRSRQRALQVLYQWDMTKRPVDEAIRAFYDTLDADKIAEEPMEEKDNNEPPAPGRDEFMEELARGASEMAPGPSTSRISEETRASSSMNSSRPGAGGSSSSFSSIGLFGDFVRVQRVIKRESLHLPDAWSCPIGRALAMRAAVIGDGPPSLTISQPANQFRHFDGRDRGVVSSLPLFRPRDRWPARWYVVRRKPTGCRSQLHRGQAARSLSGHMIEMRRIAGCTAPGR